MSSNITHYALLYAYRYTRRKRKKEKEEYSIHGCRSFCFRNQRVKGVPIIEKPVAQMGNPFLWLQWSDEAPIPVCHDILLIFYFALNYQLWDRPVLFLSPFCLYRIIKGILVQFAIHDFLKEPKRPYEFLADMIRLCTDCLKLSNPPSSPFSVFISSPFLILRCIESKT